MAKLHAVAAFIGSALCFSFLLGFTQASDHFYVQGRIYCDPCRVEFETKLSHPMAGVDIHVECRKIESGELTTKVKGETNENGKYNIRVDGEHEEEICEVMTTKSTHPECAENMDGRDSDVVVLTRNNGVTSKTRYANALGFMTMLVDSKCDQVLKDLEFYDLDITDNRKTKSAAPAPAPSS